MKDKALGECPKVLAQSNRIWSQNVKLPWMVCFVIDEKLSFGPISLSISISYLISVCLQILGDFGVILSRDR